MISRLLPGHRRTTRGQDRLDEILKAATPALLQARSTCLKASFAHFSRRLPLAHPAFRPRHIALPVHQTVMDLSCIAPETLALPLARASVHPGAFRE